MLAAVVAGAALAMTACNTTGGGAVNAAKASLASLNFASGSAKQHNAPANTGDLFKGPRNDPAAMKWVELTAGSANGLSPIVHDAAGFTFYRFDKDTANPPKSNCNGACAVTWPPVLVKQGSRIFFNGVPREAIGVVKRDDGNLQVTLGGWPIYHFSQDTAPGQTNGEGVGGTWFAVSPQGQKVLPVAGSSTPPTSNPPIQPTDPSAPTAPSAPPATTAPGTGTGTGGDVTLGNGNAILDSGKNFSEPNGSVGASGPGCSTLSTPFTALSLQLAGGPIKIWSGPNCTGTSKVISSSVADLPAFGFNQPIASIRFGG
jgi:predicted lipoprotein with Yx(FWY)xxD motif